MHTNVGRGGEAHDLALQLGFNEGADVISIQEPWVMRDPTTRTTKTHASYTLFAPCTNWDDRPRALIYVRRDRQRNPVQTVANISRDFLAVQLNTTSGPVTVWGVYNAPLGSLNAGEGLAHFLANPPRARAVVVGDFNLRHPDWDPSAYSPSDAAHQLANWLDTAGFFVLNPGVSTHSRGGVLDLAITDDPGATAAVAAHLHSTSDHETVWVFSPGGLPQTATSGRLKTDKCDHRILRDLLAPHLLPIAEDIDVEAQELVTCIMLAMEGSTPRTKTQTQGSRWWSDDCQQARRKYHAARRFGPADEESHELRAAVRRAKRDYWRQRIEQDDSLRNAYQVTKWHKQLPPFHSPPLQGPAGLVVHPLDKAKLLKETLLDRSDELTDIDLTEMPPPTPCRKLSWGPVTKQEAYKATCLAKSTTPGTDEIETKMLKDIWPSLGDRITSLFQKCIAEGRHPKAFKRAEVVMIPKPNKRDRSIPKAYRPIALLSCLGKGLERLLARRVSFLALRHQVLGKNQCSAVSSRAATDLTTALACDIEQQWAKKELLAWSP